MFQKYEVKSIPITQKRKRNYAPKEAKVGVNEPLLELSHSFPSLPSHFLRSSMSSLPLAIDSHVLAPPPAPPSPPFSPTPPYRSVSVEKRSQ